jgi:hypothetical protein
MDSDDAAPLPRVVKPLNAYGFPVQKASAKHGEGVLDTLETILRTTRVGVEQALDGNPRSMHLRANRRRELESDEDTVRRHVRAIRGSATPDASEDQRTDYLQPEHEVEVPFQPRDFAGSHPVRILDANVDEGQVVVDVELERMGGGEARGLRVRLANRPTDSPAASPRPSYRDPAMTSPILGVTDHLPDRIELNTTPESSDLPPVVYGAAGLAGGLVVGVMAGFLLFN